MKEKKMGFFKKFFNSLFNFKAYNTFLAQTTGKAVLYMLILCSLLSIINCFLLLTAVNFELPNLKEDIKEKVPEFEFKNGKLTFEGDMPIIIKDEESDMIVYIDTENPIDNSVLDNYSNATLITSDSITQKQGIQTRSVNLSPLTDMKLDKDTIIKSIPDKIPVIIAIIFYIFFVLFYFLGELIGAFIILGIAGTILSKVMKKELKYSESFKLGLYALTVPMLISTICTLLTLIGIIIPFSGYISYAIAIIYLGFGINAIDNNTIEKLEEFEQLY
ncbi:MAG: DUF1189 domain-containing protein [Bacilli bacterium]|nr:DUF1189 domain-containing protein [Bacilli bacterium]